MKLLIFSFIFTILLMGCVGPEVTPDTPAGQSDQTCSMVTDSQPTIEEQCGNVSFTEPVCGSRTLEYIITDVPKIDLCVADGPCVGRSISECTNCWKAMARCSILITNTDNHDGIWVVGANYTLGNYSFIKNPISLTIRPNESQIFDFQQIYVPGSPINTAVCSLSVVSEPIIEECYEETRVTTECANVTVYVDTEKEVCQ
ncbi:hypothetical protein KKF81_00540 [Candidatus Micrarchaeota archaeon]|nr:hypothetical protein [Candidatus Micrarchaeota archaeon]MBU1165406.1 hypothetical protein [Candidatus Micrarchaeota archaeon]MBU1886956.1 hypothetical protein [Candidatus Micrarchaeota archaeon]